MVDCSIVGGGIIGMMTARELCRAGLKVQILDKGQPGREASWAGGGILSPLDPWDTPASLWPIINWSQQQYPHLCLELIEETGIDPEYLVSGLLIFDPVEQPSVQYWHAQTGCNVRILEGTRIAQLVSGLDPGLQSAIYAPGVAQVRNPRLLKALHQSLIKNGVHIIENVEVRSIEVQANQVTGVATSKGVFNADRVVIAAGAWSSAIGHSPVRIFPVRGQMLRINAPDLGLKPVLLKDGAYIIPRGDGQILIGSTIEDVGFDKATTPEAAQQLMAKAIAMLPALSDYTVSQQWAGLRPASEKGIPVIQSHPEINGLFYNTGHFRNGVVLAPGSARILADMILNRSSALLSSWYQ